MTMNRYLFEYLATFAFAYVIIATGGNVYASSGIFAILLILGAKITGTLLNPAMTLAMLSMGKVASSDVLPFIGVQIAGALTAAELVKRLRIGV